MDFFKRIEVQLRKSLPFVVYRKPGETMAKAILQSDDRLHHFGNYTQSGFLFAPFDSGHPTVLLVPDELLEASAAVSPGHYSVPDATETHFDTEEKERHIHLVEKAIRTIGDAGQNNKEGQNNEEDQKNEEGGLKDKGGLKKIVLSRRLEIPSNASPLDLFRSLPIRYPNAFCYLWFHPKVGLWLGATPEILLLLRHRKLTTMSLAGTQPYPGIDHPEWGRKEIDEQQLVTEYIIEALQGHVRNLERGETESIRAGNLLHLRTRITAELVDENLGAVVEALHPTPAVCGLPKKPALEFIRENESYDREYYTGFLGELNLSTEIHRNFRRKNQENRAYRPRVKATTLYVNLRCMQLKDGKAVVYVGGGITKDSDPEREWEETVAKSRTMLSILE